MAFESFQKSHQQIYDSNWTRTHHHLVHKGTLNHLAKLAKFCTCFKQRGPWHSGNHRVWIGSEMRTWHNKNIQSANLCKSIYDIINYSTTICLFKSGNCGKEAEKLQKCEYLQNEKSFLGEMKNIFQKRTTIWWKSKSLIKSSQHEF